MYNLCFAGWIYYDSFYRDLNRSAWAFLALLFGFVAVPAYFLKSREDNEDYINFLKYFGLWLIGFILFSVLISGGAILKTIDAETLLQSSSIAFVILLFYVILKFFLNKSNEKLSAPIPIENDDIAKYSFSFKRVFKKIANDNDSKNIIRDVSLILLVHTLFRGLGLLLTEQFMLLPGICIHLGLIFLLWKFCSRFAALLLLSSSLLTLYLYAVHLINNTNIENIIELSIPLFIFWVKLRAAEATFKIHGLPFKSEKSYQLAYKVYFWVLAILLIPLFLLARESDIFYIYPIIDLSFAIVSLIGLFGYVFQKQFFRPITWKIWLFIYVGWEVYYFFLTVIAVDIEIPVVNNIIIFMIAVTLTLPLFIALYLYGYKSDQLWNFNYKT